MHMSRNVLNVLCLLEKERLPALPLQPIKIEQPFQKWGVDFIGPINPP